MIKRILLPFLAGLVIAGCSFGQTVTNTQILRDAAAGYKLSFDANYAKAMTLAKRNGWPLSFKTRSGGNATLVGVDNFNHPKYYITTNNTIAAATTRASQLWPGGSSGLNLSGSTAALKNKIAIWDGGSVLGTHVELTGRVTQKDNPSSLSDHSTHVSGTMIASGVNPVAKGMAFGAQGMIAYDYNNDLSEMANEAPGLLISNHSYSIIAGWNYNTTQSRWEFNGRSTDNEDYKFGYYSNDAQTLDSIAYNAPYYLIVKSAGNNRSENGPAVGQPYYRYNASGQMASAGNRPAGISSNDGYDIISWDCGAKNILTVGAVPGIPSGYSRKEDVVLTDFSSWGPTDDGRIKPDVVADGVDVLSCVSTGNSAYASYSGTSMASPNAAGSLFLLQEYYAKLKSGAYLRSATLKGLAIHTADEAGPSPGPDYQFGWGLLDVKKAADVITAAVSSNNGTSSQHLMFENNLTQGQVFTQTVIASGKGPLQATICWTDVKGPVDNVNVLNNRTKVLVNDLDVRITTGSGATARTYYPWTLDVNNPSFSAVHGDNITDNVERVDIDSTIPGQTYTITVSHKGTLSRGQQAYSLLVSGAGGSAYCTSASGGGGARIDSVNFNTIHFGNTAGSKTYTNNTNYVTDVEPSSIVPIKVQVSTADATTNSRMVKVFIDFNNNGQFDAGELVATSGVLSSATQTYTGNISIPSTVIIGNYCLMRVIVQETSNAGDINACGNYSKGETEDYRIHITNPSNDVSISDIVSPAAGDCASNAQYLTVNLRNNGSVSQSNIPITATISSGSTTIATLSFTYPGPLLAQSTASYTFQSPFVTTAGTTYTISATTNLAADQYAANNTLSAAIATAAKPDAVTAIAGICGTTANLKVTNSNFGSNYFWYSSATGTSPFANGSQTSTSTIPGDKTYYVAREASVSVGPANKLVYPSGGYNAFLYNYVKINNTVPVTLQTARLYIGYPGKIRFTLANLTSETSTSFSYQPLATTTLDVYPTTPTPAQGAVSGNNASDTGAIYFLNLPVASPGDHIIFIECLDKNGNVDSLSTVSTAATIFRNNSITGTSTYPTGATNILTITGNSAHNTTGATDAQFYYFFYDLRASTGCTSDRIPVVATTATAPSITQQGDSLVSANATGTLQWYVNDSLITGATVNHYKPNHDGVYKLVTIDALGCQQTSNTITYKVTATIDVQAAEIGLKISPNPNNGVFQLSFEVTTRADLNIDMYTASGQRVYTSSYPDFTGKFSQQIIVPQLSSDVYMLKIRHNKKTYLQKIVIAR